MLINLKLAVFIGIHSVWSVPIGVGVSPTAAQLLTPPAQSYPNNNDASFQNTGVTFGDSFNSGSGNQFSPINSIGGISGTGISKAFSLGRRARVHHKLI